MFSDIASTFFNKKMQGSVGTIPNEVIAQEEGCM